jgi:DNA-binding transcriptional ArsR family regulator
MRDRDLRDVKAAYEPVKKLMKRLNDEPRHRIFALVREREDLMQALCSWYRANGPDLPAPESDEWIAALVEIIGPMMNRD